MSVCSDALAASVVSTNLLAIVLLSFSAFLLNMSRAGNDSANSTGQELLIESGSDDDEEDVLAVAGLRSGPAVLPSGDVQDGN